MGNGAADPGLGHGGSWVGGLELPAQLPPPTPSKPGPTLPEALTDSSRSKTVPRASLPLPRDSPSFQGLRQLSLGILREGLQLRPCPSENSAAVPGLTYLIPLLAPWRGTQLQPYITRTVLLIAASLVNGTAQQGLFCCSFSRCWGLGPTSQGPGRGLTG